MAAKETAWKDIGSPNCQATKLVIKRYFWCILLIIQCVSLFTQACSHKGSKEAWKKTSNKIKKHKFYKSGTRNTRSNSGRNQNFRYVGHRPWRLPVWSQSVGSELLGSQREKGKRNRIEQSTIFWLLIKKMYKFLLEHKLFLKELLGGPGGDCSLTHISIAEVTVLVSYNIPPWQKWLSWKIFKCLI